MTRHKKICALVLMQFKIKLFPDESCKKALKTRVNCQNFSSLHRTKQKLARCACLKSQILIYQRAGTVGVNAINASNYSIQRVWLVALATILSKTPKTSSSLHECNCTQLNFLHYTQALSVVIFF